MSSQALAPGFITLGGTQIFVGLSPCPVCGRLYAYSDFSGTDAGLKRIYQRHLIDGKRGIQGGTCQVIGDKEFDQALRNLRGIRRAVRRGHLKDFPLPQDLRWSPKLYRELMNPL